jgi:hypothetical protein
LGLSIEEIEMRLELLTIQLAELSKIVNEIEAQAKQIEDGHV